MSIKYFERVSHCYLLKPCDLQKRTEHNEARTGKPEHRRRVRRAGRLPPSPESPCPGPLLRLESAVNRWRGGRRLNRVAKSHSKAIKPFELHSRPDLILNRTVQPVLHNIYKGMTKLATKDQSFSEIQRCNVFNDVDVRLTIRGLFWPKIRLPPNPTGHAAHRKPH